MRTLLLAFALIVGCGSSTRPADAGGPETDGGVLVPESCPGIALGGPGRLDLDVPLVRVSGRLTIDGAGLSADAVARLVIEFEDEALGTRFLLDRRNVAPGGSYETAVPPGTYTIRYLGLLSCNDSTELPCNPGQLEIGAALSSSGVLDLDLATAVLQVAVSAQGVPATRGVVSVAPVGTDRGAVDVPITAGLARARLLRGTYRVGYEHTICGDPEPCGWHRLPDAIDLRSDGAVELTVPLIELVGTTTLDGAPTPLGLELTLSQVGEGELALPLAAGRFLTRVVPGTYDVVARAPGETCRVGRALPCVPAPVLRGLTLTASGALEIPITTIEVLGNARVGVPITRGRGALVIQGEAGEGRTPPLADGGGAFGARVVVGSYAVRFDGDPADCLGPPVELPCNDGVLVPTRHYAAGGVLDVAIPTVHVTGTAAGAASVWFAAEGDASGPVRVPVTGVAYAATLLAGTYDVDWSSTPLGCALSRDVVCAQVRALDAVRLETDGALDVPAAPFDVVGTVQIAGLPPASGGETGLLVFAAREGRGLAHVPVGASGAYALALLEETYVVSYEPPESLCADPSRNGPCGVVIGEGCPR